MDSEWKLLLRSGFGNVFPLGRWDHGSTILLARAINTSDWSLVIEYANSIEWVDDMAN